MNKHKILVIRFSSLGDIILTLPVYKNIKTFLPNSYVAVAVKEKYASILQGYPYIDEILSFPEGGSIFSFLQKVRKEKFSVLLDLHNNIRSNLLSFFSGIPMKFRYKKAGWQRRLFVLRKVYDPELQRHSIDRYLDVLKELGINPERFQPELPLPSGVSENKIVLRILVIQTAFLGDAVLTTPLFEAIRNSYPSIKITLLSTPENQQIFEKNPNIDELLIMDKRGKDRGILSIFHWAKRLKNRFDIVILPHRSFRSSLLAWLARIPIRIGFSNSEGRFFLTDTVPFDWKTHDAERNLKLLDAIGIKSHQPKFFIPYPASDTVFESLYSEYHIPKNALLVGINPGSVWKTKQWLPERFAETADKLIEEWNCKVILFGSDKDRQAVYSLIQSMKHPVIDLCGKTDLKSLSWWISKCALFISNDSGPMHVACALNVPVVAIFGPTTRELGFFPYGKKSAVVELDLPCRPCSLHGGNKCPLEHFRCMRDLTAEMVLAPCRKFLSERQLSQQQFSQQ